MFARMRVQLKIFRRLINTVCFAWRGEMSVNDNDVAKVFTLVDVVKESGGWRRDRKE